MAASIVRRRFTDYQWLFTKKMYYCSSFTSNDSNRTAYNMNKPDSVLKTTSIRYCQCYTGVSNLNLPVHNNSDLSESKKMFSITPNNFKYNIRHLGISQHIFYSSKKYMSSNFNSNVFNQTRNYSADGKPSKKVAMHLMDFPEIIWPSLIKSLRNWILANLVVTPYFDREFNLPQFIAGSKKAVELVSNCLFQSEYDRLDGLVDIKAVQEVKRNISSFSVQQRQELSIRQEDIYFCFPYQVGVMFSDDEKSIQKRFVEITMCYHVLQGLGELKRQGITPPLNMGMMPEYRDKIHICNYRFIREFTKGVEGGWTINVLNHFKPSDYIT